MIRGRGALRGSPGTSPSHARYGSSATFAGAPAGAEAGAACFQSSTGQSGFWWSLSVRTGRSVTSCSRTRSSSRTRPGGSGQPAMTIAATGSPALRTASAYSRAWPVSAGSALTATTTGAWSSLARSRAL